MKLCFYKFGGPCIASVLQWGSVKSQYRLNLVEILQCDIYVQREVSD